MRFLAAPALALMALTTTAHAQTALTPKTLAVLDVLSGGTISNTVDGGTVNVASGGTASSTTILGGGSETISAGGFDTSALISVGGYQLIGAGGEATSTTVAGRAGPRTQRTPLCRRSPPCLADPVCGTLILKVLKV